MPPTALATSLSQLLIWCLFLSLSSETQRILNMMDDSETYMKMQHVNPYSPSPLKETQRILDRMDDSETYMNMQLLKPYSPSSSKDGLPSSYSLMSFRKDELHIDDYEDPPTALEPAELPLAAQTAAHEHQSTVKSGKRLYRPICLLCLVTSAISVIVVGLSIHGMHNDLRHGFNEMGTKNRSVNETKAQICEMLTSRTDQTFSQDWIRNKERCYFISTLEKSYEEAKQHCSNFDASLLKITTKQEENVVSNALDHPFTTYRIGKCEDGVEASSLMYRDYTGTSFCVNCDSYEPRELCNGQHRFICEKRARVYTDLCQQSTGTT